jgi:hypothetical protein
VSASAPEEEAEEAEAVLVLASAPEEEAEEAEAVLVLASDLP